MAEPVLKIEDIMQVLPHRYPFLFVDRIVEMVPDQLIVAQKNFSMNEEFFQGHFPGRPVVPGVIMIEVLAQTGAILAKKSPVFPADRELFLAGVDNARFKRQVVPGDVALFKMTFVKQRRPLWVMDGEVTVDGKVAVSATITAVEVGPS